jgi:hypothetical protein
VNIEHLMLQKQADVEVLQPLASIQGQLNSWGCLVPGTPLVRVSGLMLQISSMSRCQVMSPLVQVPTG